MVTHNPAPNHSSPFALNTLAKNFGPAWLAHLTLLQAGLPGVAQVSNLLYRRLPVGWPWQGVARPGVRDVCGLEIRDTADWKSALQHCPATPRKKLRCGPAWLGLMTTGDFIGTFPVVNCIA
jgi:hypothetical protein